MTLTAEERRARRSFAEEFPRCWLCDQSFSVETHEIVSGSARYWGEKHREAWLRLCGNFGSGCHAWVHRNWHNPDDMAMEYALKQLKDPDHYDRVQLNLARHWPADCPELITESEVRNARALVLEVIA